MVPGLHGLLTDPDSSFLDPWNSSLFCIAWEDFNISEMGFGISSLSAKISMWCFCRIMIQSLEGNVYIF